MFATPISTAITMTDLSVTRKRYWTNPDADAKADAVVTNHTNANTGLTFIRKKMAELDSAFTSDI
jgi:hypothetical protein